MLRGPRSATRFLELPFQRSWYLRDTLSSTGRTWKAAGQEGGSSEALRTDAGQHRVVLRLLSSRDFKKVTLYQQQVRENITEIPAMLRSIPQKELPGSRAAV